MHEPQQKRGLLQFDALALVIASITALLLLKNGVQLMGAFMKWPIWSSPDASILWFEGNNLLQGKWPYRDINSINLPVTHYVNALGLALLGTDHISLRIMDAALILSIGGLIFTILLIHYSLASALLGLGLTMVFPAVATPFGAFQRETLMFFLWLIAVLLFDLSTRSRAKNSRGPERWLLFFSSFSLGVSLFVKPAGLLLAFILYLYSLAPGGSVRAISWRNTETRSRFLSMNILWATGGVAAVGVVLLPFVMAGTLSGSPSLWLRQISIYASNGAALGIGTMLSDLIVWDPTKWHFELNIPVSSLNDIGHLSIFSVVVVFFWILFNSAPRAYPLFMGLLITGLANYLIQRKGFAYHLFPVWFSISMMAAANFEILVELVRKKLLTESGTLTGRNMGREMAALLVLTLFSYGIYFRHHFSLKPYGGTGLLGNDSSSMLQYETPRDICRLAHRIRETRTDGANSGSEVTAPVTITVLEQLTIALSAVVPCHLEYNTRYPVDYNLFLQDERGDLDRAEFLKELNAKHPDIMAICLGVMGDDRPKSLHAIPGLYNFLDLYYQKPIRIEEDNGLLYDLYIQKREKLQSQDFSMKDAIEIDKQ